LAWNRKHPENFWDSSLVQKLIESIPIYWNSRSIEDRLIAVELLRKHYLGFKYDVETRF
jgi:hypothetical protein